MKISVVIPVYNAAPYLKACLDSVLHQKFSEWECICVDDGSTDGSAGILDEYARNDSRMRVVRQANAGVSAARNAGMGLATGDLVAFLDSDDTFDPLALATLSEVWTKTEAEVIRFGCNNVTDHAQDTRLSEIPAYAEINVNDEMTTPLKRCSLGAATAVSATIAKQLPWPLLTQCEDPLFVLRCLRQSQKSVFIDGALVNYLVRADSASHRVSLSVITATCRYLVLAYDECAAMPGFAKSRDDTCAFIAGFLDGPLAKCGRDVAPQERKAAEAAVRTARNLLAVRDPAFSKYACREQHDFAFVLGSSCTATDVLRQADMQFGSFPLDWIGWLDIGARTDFIVSDFADFLSADRLHPETNTDDGRHARYVDGKFGTAFFHDFPANVPLSESYPAVRAKYDRRIAKFMHHLSEAKSVLVVWVSDFRDERDGIHASDAALSQCLDRLERRFPGTHFSTLVFDQTAAGEPPREIRVSDGRIRRIALDYRDWSQGPESWALRIERLLPYLAAHEVGDYRTAGEKREYRCRLREKKRARLHATSWLDVLAADLQYRLYRHLQKVLSRKGVKLT